jgi:hypothetical protein
MVQNWARDSSSHGKDKADRVPGRIYRMPRCAVTQAHVELSSSPRSQNVFSCSYDPFCLQNIPGQLVRTLPAQVRTHDDITQ